jgi:predicted O-methyltransferase YrrM
MLETRSTLDSNGNRIKVHSISTLGNIRVIRELLIRDSCARTLEIGLAYGASALAILSTLQGLGNEEFKHVAIDPYQDKDWGGAGARLIADEGYSDHFTLYSGMSSMVLPMLASGPERYDLIYVDGSHLFEEVFVDFYYCFLILKKGGVIVFDDCCDPHVAKVMRFIKRNYSEGLVEIDYQDVEDPTKAIEKRIGNWLGFRQLRAFRKKTEPPREWNSPFRKF